MEYPFIFWLRETMKTAMFFACVGVAQALNSKELYKQVTCITDLNQRILCNAFFSKTDILIQIVNATSTSSCQVCASQPLTESYRPCISTPHPHPHPR